jgi:hypothetical protein
MTTRVPDFRFKPSPPAREESRNTYTSYHTYIHTCIQKLQEQSKRRSVIAIKTIVNVYRGFIELIDELLPVFCGRFPIESPILPAARSDEHLNDVQNLKTKTSFVHSNPEP